MVPPLPSSTLTRFIVTAKRIKEAIPESHVVEQPFYLRYNGVKIRTSSNIYTKVSSNPMREWGMRSSLKSSKTCTMVSKRSCVFPSNLIIDYRTGWTPHIYGVTQWSTAAVPVSSYPSTNTWNASLVVRERVYIIVHIEKCRTRDWPDRILTKVQETNCIFNRGACSGARFGASDTLPCSHRPALCAHSPSSS